MNTAMNTIRQLTIFITQMDYDQRFRVLVEQYTGFSKWLKKHSVVIVDTLPEKVKENIPGNGSFPSMELLLFDDTIIRRTGEDVHAWLEDFVRTNESNLARI